MTINEILILIGAMYLVLGSLLLSGNTLMSGTILPVKSILFCFFCWPYFSYRGALLIYRRFK